MDCMEDCRDVALTVLPNIFPIDMKEHCIEGSSFMNHFAKSFRQNFAFEAYKVESVPDWIFSNICTKWLVIFFRSFPLPKLINCKPRRNQPISQSQVLIIFFCSPVPTTKSKTTNPDFLRINNTKYKMRFVKMVPTDEYSDSQF